MPLWHVRTSGSVQVAAIPPLAQFTMSLNGNNPTHQIFNRATQYLLKAICLVLCLPFTFPHLIPTAIELDTLTSLTLQIRKLRYKKIEFRRQNLYLPVAQVSTPHRYTEDSLRNILSALQ